MPKSSFFIYFGGGNKQTSRDAKQHYLISVAVCCVIRTWNGTPVCVHELKQSDWIHQQAYLSLYY